MELSLLHYFLHSGFWGGVEMTRRVKKVSRSKGFEAFLQVPTYFRGSCRRQNVPFLGLLVGSSVGWRTKMVSRPVFLLLV